MRFKQLREVDIIICCGGFRPPQDVITYLRFSFRRDLRALPKLYQTNIRVVEKYWDEGKVCPPFLYNSTDYIQVQEHRWKYLVVPNGQSQQRRELLKEAHRLGWHCHDYDIRRDRLIHVFPRVSSGGVMFEPELMVDGENGLEAMGDKEVERTDGRPLKQGPTLHQIHCSWEDAVCNVSFISEFKFDRIRMQYMSERLRRGLA